MTGNTDTTAAEAVGTLCRRLSAEAEVRIVDLTGRRPRTVTGAEFARTVDESVLALRRAGVEHGDTVLFAIRPSLRALVAFLSLIQTGARTAFVQMNDPVELIEARVAKIDPRWILTESKLALAARPPIRRLLRLAGISIPPLRSFAPEVITLRSRTGHFPDGAIHTPGLNDDALVVFTSGTAGDPKAVVHSQRSLAVMLDTLVSLIGDASSQVVYSRELHAIIPALATGASAVIGAPDASPERVAGCLGERAITTWFTTPATARKTAPLIQSANRLERIVLGSAPVTAALVDDLQRRLPAVEIVAVYAMTEAVPVAIATGAEIVAHIGDGDLVGPIVAGVEAEIDADGVLWISGSGVGRYLGKATGPIDTGDLAHYTAGGPLVLDGRSKEMILVDGVNIYPQHYESSFGTVRGITEGALVGLPDWHGLETLWTVVDLDGTRSLAQVIAGLRSVDLLRDLPLTGLVAAPLSRGGRSGKLDREKLRGTVSHALEDGSCHLLSPGQ